LSIFFAPFVLFCPLSPRLFFRPIACEHDPKGAIPPSLRTTGPDVTIIQERVCACG